MLFAVYEAKKACADNTSGIGDKTGLAKWLIARLDSSMRKDIEKLRHAQQLKRQQKSPQSAPA